MSAIRSKDNKVETALRRELHSRGLRYRKYSTIIAGKPDIAFASARVAVFVDGDFWHCRTLREGGQRALEKTLTMPTRAYWLEKFTRNVARDDWVTSWLEKEGWKVLRYWESDVEADLSKTASAIETGCS